MTSQQLMFDTISDMKEELFHVAFTKIRNR